MPNSVIYNALKLSEYREMFHNKKALVIGAGAVGTYLMEYLAKMGVSPDAVDFDFFTLENAAKHGCIIRTPEDAGKNKAVCVSERTQPLLDEGCSTNGIDGDICKLGPEAFADYDVVIAAVDNFDAKVLLNELIRQIPEERRPVVIMDGTHDEMAQSVILDNKEFCLRCLIDEKWMKDSSIRTSCTGPQLRSYDGVPEIVRTTHLASSMAAHMSVEQFRAFVIGHNDVMNRRITYTAYPNLEISISHPMKKRNCPGCAEHAPAEINWLEGCMMKTTLREVIRQLTQILGTDDFEISVHRLNYRKIVHAEFIVDDVCRCCGKPIKVMRHSGRTFANDLKCDECRQENRIINPDIPNDSGVLIRAFNKDSDDALLDMTMYDLGFPLGAHIEVIERNGAWDFLDKDKIKFWTFAMDNDHAEVHFAKKLD